MTKNEYRLVWEKKVDRKINGVGRWQSSQALIYDWVKWGNKEYPDLLHWSQMR